MPVTSPYRFVPIGTPMVTPPLSMDNISHNRPIEGQQSGEISVTWTAETPICIGHKEDQNGVVQPFHLKTGKERKYAIPGASIKGMIRNVMSIATFSHLGRINSLDYSGKHSVADVAARTLEQKDSTYKLQDLKELDFARAIFGDVEGAMDDKGKKQSDDHGLKALKGRVFFGFAFSDEAILKHEIFEAQMMGPKSSFWPFYLVSRDNRNNPASYNDDYAILAGRKRYPAMKELVTPNGPQRRAGRSTISRIQFLEGGTKFNQTIRFHNLHPVELGGLLWCLKFGYTKGNKYRHQVGRGKAFGYGRVRCMFNFDEMSMNEPRVDSLINDFKKHMADALPGPKGDNDKSYWESSPTIDALLKLSHPTDSGDYKYIEEIGSFADIKTRRKGPLLPIKKK